MYSIIINSSFMILVHVHVHDKPVILVIVNDIHSSCASLTF